MALLERYHVPVFLFLNKMDLAGADRAACMEELRAGLGLGVWIWRIPQAEEDRPLQRELWKRSPKGSPTDAQLAAAVSRRELFLLFGAALKLEG